jgi:hypothetical protein
MGNHRSEVSPTRNSVQPSAFAHTTPKVAQELEAVRYHMRNKAEGCYVYDPTSASTQASGTGNTTWRVNIDRGVIIINGTAYNYAGGADVSVHSGSHLMANLYTCVAAIVAYGTTPTILAIKGTPALTAGGTAVGPTKAAIQAAVDAAAGATGTKWIKLAETTLNRTADTTVTQSHDLSKRSLLAVNEDTGFGDWSEIS